MGKSIEIRESLGNVTDLTTPTSTQQYPLGKIIEIYDDTYNSIKKYMYVKSHSTLTQYGIYVIRFLGTAGSEVVTALSTDTSSLKGTHYYTLSGVAEVAFTSGYYGWICIQGMTTVTTAGAVTILHACKLGDAVATVATEAAATVTAYTVGIAVSAASPGAANISFYLIGMDRQADQYTAP